MNIFFTIYHLFLVSHFPRVRRRLLGQGIIVVPRMATITAVPDPTWLANIAPIPEVFAEEPEIESVPKITENPKQTRQFDVKLPSFNSRLPEVSMPGIELPKITVPKFELPHLTVPKIAVPTLKFPKKAKLWALNGAIALSILALGIIFLPDIYYTIAPPDTEPIAAVEEGTVRGGAFNRTQAENQVEPSPTPRPLPPKDETLPEGDWIIIPRIGVRTQLQPTADPNEALETGVWMTPEYGRPGATDMPVIAAAHRFGWQWWWKDDYWKYHSFYLLPDLQPGDTVELISDKRKYYYEIYAGEEGDQITDYMADLILYTCKFLNSPVRHIRYARLIDMEKNTQVSAVN